MDYNESKHYNWYDEIIGDDDYLQDLIIATALKEYLEKTIVGGSKDV